MRQKSPFLARANRRRTEGTSPSQPSSFLANSHTASCIPRHTPAHTNTPGHPRLPGTASALTARAPTEERLLLLPGPADGVDLPFRSSDAEASRNQDAAEEGGEGTKQVSCGLGGRIRGGRGSSLTLSCRASARPRGTSPAPPAGCWAPDTPSRCTEEDGAWSRTAATSCPDSEGGALTLTSSLWLMARAECSSALMTEA